MDIYLYFIFIFYTVYHSLLYIYTQFREHFYNFRLFNYFFHYTLKGIEIHLLPVFRYNTKQFVDRIQTSSISKNGCTSINTKALLSYIKTYMAS